MLLGKLIKAPHDIEEKPITAEDKKNYISQWKVSGLSKRNSRLKGFDSLSGLVRNEYKMDPLTGDVFVFFSRQLSKVKLLHWQGDGFAIFSKRLERRTFEMPGTDSAAAAIEISSEQLQFILKGIVLSSVKKRVRYEHGIVDKNPVLARLSAH